MVFIFFCTLQIASQSKPAPGSDFTTIAAKAAAARETEHLDEALSLYKKAVGINPRWAEGWFYLGTLHYDRDNYAPAAAAFRRVIAIQPNSGTALVMLGLCEFQLGQDSEALRHLEKGKEIGVSNDPELRQTVLFDEALLLQRKGSFETAREPLDQLCRDKVDRKEIIQALGLVQLRLRATDPRAKLDPAPKVVEAVGQAGCLAAQKRYDEARPAFAEIVKDFPNFPNVHYAFGNFLADLPDVAAAREQYELEIKNNPADVLSRLKIAALLYRTDSAAAIPFAREAIKIDPKVPLAHYLLGLLLLDTDDYKGAIPELELAKKGLPAEPKLYFALGTAYSRAGRNAEAAQAREQFQRLQKKQPD
ncbi:MAG TPA: tetratricopeptide repeat protein [Armatimonadota bacterium]|jgi:tetratricopeptide (TPR) repeat protein